VLAGAAQRLQRIVAKRAAEDEDALARVAPLTYDIRLNVGSDFRETDGYVYGRVIRAVEDYNLDWERWW
jgi:hypothetical protein